MRVFLTRPVELATSVGTARLNDVGLGYVASSCAEAGADVVLTSWDTRLDPDLLRDKLASSQPRLVGLKVFTTSFREAQATLRIVREVLPDAVTMIGGPHPSTSTPEDLFAEFDGLLDFAIAGDGERGAADLVKLVRSASGMPAPDDLGSVPGLVYRSNGQVRSNAPGMPLDLDALAPLDWSHQPVGRFSRELYGDHADAAVLVSDSRGCIARCGHCMAWLINGADPRKRSAGSLCEELHALVGSHGVRAIEFTGNGFLSDPDYVHELCDFMTARRLPIRWGCTGAAYLRNLRDTRLLNVMRKAGCAVIHYGIESGSTKVLERLRKPFGLSDCAETVAMTAAAGIQPVGYFMFGFPDETLDDMQDTVEFAASLPFALREFCICLPLPSTSSYKAILDRDGIGRIDWAEFDVAQPKLLASEASPAQVNRVLEQARGAWMSRTDRWKTQLRRWKSGVRRRVYRMVGRTT